MHKFLFLSGVALAAVCVSPAAAQTAATPAPSNQKNANQDNSEIVVTGTRAVGRTRLDTIAPVDVLSATDLKH